MKNFLLLPLALLALCAMAQNGPPVADKNDPNAPKLVTRWDTTEFKTLQPGKNGLERRYVLSVADVSYINTARKRVYIADTVLVCIEASIVNGVHEGIISSYVINNGDHNKRYKIYEQDYKNDTLNGHWKAWDLGGTLKYDLLYFMGKSRGKSFYYGPDGKTVDQMNNYRNDSVFVATKYYDGIRRQAEETMVNNVRNGRSTLYYPNGQIQSTVNFANGQFNDTLKFYHDNGVLWTEEIFKNGKDWTVLNNFDRKGKPHPPGTLKDGYGSRILYTDDGAVRDSVVYVHGIGTK